MQNYNQRETIKKLRDNGFDTNPVSGGKHYKYYHKVNKNIYVTVPKHKIVNGAMFEGALKKAMASL